MPLQTNIDVDTGDEEEEEVKSHPEQNLNNADSGQEAALINSPTQHGASDGVGARDFPAYLSYSWKLTFSTTTSSTSSIPILTYSSQIDPSTLLSSAAPSSITQSSPVPPVQATTSALPGASYTQSPAVRPGPTSTSLSSPLTLTVPQTSKSSVHL